MSSSNELRKLLDSIMTDEIKDLVENGERVVNKQRLESFMTMLDAVITATKDDPSVRVKYALCDQLNPLSGFIVIIGRRIELKPAPELQEAVGDISYIAVDNCNDDETSITIGYNKIIELRKRG